MWNRWFLSGLSGFLPVLYVLSLGLIDFVVVVGWVDYESATWLSKSGPFSLAETIADHLPGPIDRLNREWIHWCNDFGNTLR